MSDWISVKDRLPDEGQFVLVDKGQIFRGHAGVALYSPRLNYKFPWRDGFGSGDGPSVSYWMPLPEPPGA